MFKFIKKISIENIIFFLIGILLVTLFNKHISKTIKPKKELAKPKKELAKPKKELSKPKKELTKPKKEPTHHPNYNLSLGKTKGYNYNPSKIVYKKNPRPLINLTPSVYVVDRIKRGLTTKDTNELDISELDRYYNDSRGIRDMSGNPEDPYTYF